MTKESILHRIKKLKALAEDKANVNEAASAAAMAQKLITQHRIAEAELDEISLDVEVEIETSRIVEGKTLSTWKSRLANSIAMHNNCQCLVRTARKVRRIGTVRTAFIAIIGSDENINIVKYLYAVLVKDIDYLCEEEMLIRKAMRKKAGKRYSISFRLGATATIHLRLEEAHREGRKDASNGALVRVDSEMDRVADWISDNYGNISMHGVKTSADEEAYLDGQRAAENINLSGDKEIDSPKKEIQ